MSTGRQAESGLWISDQRRQIETYCADRHREVAAEFVEAGNTATDDRRPAYQSMIDAALAKPPAFSVIVVHWFSRFFRDQFQFEFYVRKLATDGVRLISITQDSSGAGLRGLVSDRAMRGPSASAAGKYVHPNVHPGRAASFRSERRLLQVVDLAC